MDNNECFWWCDWWPADEPLPPLPPFANGSDTREARDDEEELERSLLWRPLWSPPPMLLNAANEEGEINELGLKRIRYCEAAPNTSNMVDRGDETSAADKLLPPKPTVCLPPCWLWWCWFRLFDDESSAFDWELALEAEAPEDEGEAIDDPFGRDVPADGLGWTTGVVFVATICWPPSSELEILKR